MRKIFVTIFFLTIGFFSYFFYPCLVHADTTSNLVGRWTFDSSQTTWGVSSTTNDSSVNGYNGSLINFYSSTSTIEGVFNQGLKFNGVNSYISLPLAAASGSLGTVSAWIYGQSAAPTGDVVSSAGTSDITHNMRFNTGNLISVVSNNGSATANSLSGNTTISPGKWHLVVYTSSGSVYKMYVDGYLQSITVNSGSNNGLWFGGVSGRSNFQIGLLTRTTSQVPFNGSMDDVRVYSRELSITDVQELYAAGYTPTITTSNASSVTGTTATLNGSIDMSSTASSTIRGFAYGTSATLATVIATTSESGTFENGSFSANISDLTADTIYYVRAYASNATSTGYGSIQPFFTGVTSAPTVTVQAASSVTFSTATLNGNITDTGNLSPTFRGFAYGTDITYSTATTSESGTFGTGAFTAAVTGLSCSTTYHVRAYASSTAGIGYSGDQTFDTSTCVAPGSPTALATSTGSSNVYLSWTAPVSDGGTSITDYTIEYKNTADSTWTTFADGVSSATSAVVTGLTNSTGYDFRVSATNSIGTGDPSSTVSATPIGFTSSISGFWNLNESSGTRADSVGANTLSTQGGSVSATTGKINSAALFSGSNWLAIDDNSSLSVSGAQSFTLTGWVYLTSKSTNSPIVAKYDSSGTNQREYFLQYSSSADRFSFGVSPDGNTNYALNANSFGSPSLNTWYYVVAWYDAVAGTINIQVNNSTVDSTAYSSGIYNGTAAFSIGSYSHGTTVFLTGRVDGVGMWKRVLNSQDRSTLYNSGNGQEYPFNDTVITVTDAVTTLKVVRGNTKALLSWDVPTNIGGSAITDYEVFYKSEGAGSYTTFSDGTSLSTSTIVTGLTNGIPYYFKVRAVNGAGASADSNVASTTPLNEPYYTVFVTGQSLSLGGPGGPTNYLALTTTQPYNNVMYANGTLQPLIEDWPATSEPGNTETVNSSLGNTITSIIGASPFTSILTTRSGCGGCEYLDIKKNGNRTVYADAINNITTLKSLTDSLSQSNAVSAMVLIHGEQDHIVGTTKATYESNIRQLRSDYQTDIEAITGQSSTIPMFTDQMMAFTYYNAATSVIPSAQLAASEDDPNIYLVTPKYMLNYGAVIGSHLTNSSYRWLGEYYGKVIKKVMFDHEDWKPLSPKTIVRNGRNIYVTFNVPVAPITIDTTNVLLKSNYGFEYSDSSSSASISSVSIIADNAIKIVLNTTPSGSSQKLRYAYTGTAGSYPGAQVSGSARGNIRDSDPTPSLYGNNLYNWLVSFDKSISSGSAPTISTASPTSLSPTSITLNASMTSDGNASSTDQGFYYGTTDSYGLVASTTGSFSNGSFSQSLTGLTPNTTYHYQVFATNVVGTTVSSDQTFTTTALPTYTIGGTISGLTGTVVLQNNSGDNLTLSSNGSFTFDTSITSNNSYSVSILTQPSDQTCSVGSGSGTALGDVTSVSVTCTTNSATPSSNSGDSSTRSSSSGGTVSAAQLTRILAPSDLTTAYINSLTVPGCPIGYNCAPKTKINTTIGFSLPDTNLVVGSQGNGVIALQNFLISKKYLGSSYRTGYFGPLTQSALAKYQADHNIFPAVGYYGPITRATINSDILTVKSVPVTPVSTTTTTFTRDLYLGMTGPDVLKLQKFLNANQFIIAASGPGSIGKETEYFGLATRDALIKFQTYNHITPAAGYFGPVTRVKVESMVH